MMIKCCTFISKTFLLLNIYTFVGFWSNESSKGYFHWKIEGQRKLPIASEASVDILRGLSLYNISESELHHWKFIQFICSVQKYSENWCQYKKLSFVARTFKLPGNICQKPGHRMRKCPICHQKRYKYWFINKWKDAHLAKWYITALFTQLTQVERRTEILILNPKCHPRLMSQDT